MTRSDAERALAEAYSAAKAMLPGDRQVQALREAAFRRFAAEGLPHRRIEEWKYTDLRTLMREAKPLAPAPTPAARAKAKDAGMSLSDIDARRIVFVDGRFVAELSDVTKLEKGLAIRPMADALDKGDPLVAGHLGKIGIQEFDGVLALNTALMLDGALIHVASGATVERPIHLVFASSGEKPVSVFTRSLVVIEKGAQAMLVESSECKNADQVNSALELLVGEDAHVDHIKIFGGEPSVLHISSLVAAIGGRARYNDFSFVVGGAVVRNQLFVCLQDAGSTVAVRGASLLRGRQHADNTLVIDHRAGGCQSREIFKAVLDGESRGVFQGKIIVRPNAQKTDAKMMTQALLLSENAEADNKPELEIFADDVQCGHGATSGALDKDLKFYLMARGIPEKEAEALLVQAFVGEAIEGIEHAGLRDALIGQVAAWLRRRR
ncbi:MAG TPA: Fe-S cluster assembly protein SufD [Xanthobacteraceae bacterium]|nr:Fe-S cluster assembly protein SufD [Xanthobacteraceae bacterium]